MSSAGGRHAEPRRLDFPERFLFGVGSAAFQIEGAAGAGGKGESVWDRFAGRRRGLSGSETACDHYNRLEEDLDLLAELGVNAYRFSISWPRVLPRGHGRINHAGLDFYHRLVDGLLARGITPFATLFHWDTPQVLEARIGGFKNRDIAAYFGEFARIVARRLGDRVSLFATINEPSDYSIMGHLLGAHAPGKRGLRSLFASIHHQLLAHGHAVRAIRDEVPGASVGYCPNIWRINPATDSILDRRAARIFSQFFNTVYIDPVLLGEYPTDLFTRFVRFFPAIREGDLGVISTPIDFLGINTYTRHRAAHCGLVPFFHGILDFHPVPRREYKKGGRHFTSMGWEVHPPSIRRVLNWAWERYNVPLYVTESGAAFTDRCVDGFCADDARRDYLVAYLRETAAAVVDGADVRGYFVWTFMDNFEWSFAYKKRFGLIYVDFETLDRRFKKSGLWYRRFLSGSSEVPSPPGVPPGHRPPPPRSSPPPPSET